MRKILTVIMVVIALQLAVASIASASSGTYHTVRYGETLYSIGRYYGVSPYKIADANGLYNPNYIYAGQVLYIPPSGGNCGSGCGNPGQGQGQYHKVKYGETLYSIGRYYGVNPYYIAKANNLHNPNYIYAGQVLYIPSGGQGGCGGCVDPGYGVPAPPQGCGGNPCYPPPPSQGCGSGCTQPQPCPHNNCGGGYWGYDYTGYYYGQGQDRYSYTCGYYYNCW